MSDKIFKNNCINVYDTNKYIMKIYCIVYLIILIAQISILIYDTNK
jgi:hypothetical protein